MTLKQKVRCCVLISLALPGGAMLCAQSNGDLEHEIRELRERRISLEERRDSIEEELAELDRQLEDREFAYARQIYGSDGYPAVVTMDRCDLSMSGATGLPGKGTKVLVTGATHDGYWKIAYRDGEGMASDHCLRFTDRDLNIEALRKNLVGEALAMHEAAQRRQDSIKAIAQAREDSLKNAELERLAEEVAEIQAGYDAIGRTNYPIRIHDVWVAEMNSVGAVTVGLNAQYFKKGKTIKYLYFTLIPYNAVGDEVRCGIRRTSEFIGKVTGPVSAQYDPYFWFWEAAWYNSAITCVKVSKVRVEYTDGTSYTYVRELDKILGEYSNLCALD